MKNIDIIKNFINKSERMQACGHLAIFENKLINYSTVIAQWKDNTLMLNVKKYSSTTSRIQSTIKYEAESQGVKIEEYEGEPCYYWNMGYQGAPTIKKSEISSLI